MTDYEKQNNEPAIVENDEKKDTEQNTKNEKIVIKNKVGGFPRIVIILVLLIVLVGGIAFIVSQKNKTKVSVTTLEQSLEKASDLTTAKLTYCGLVKYKKGTAFLNKTSFSMLYEAKVTAGIDVKDIKFDVTDSQVTVKYPKAKILSAHVMEDSLQFFDENFALFKSDEKDALVEAMKLAKKELKKKKQYKNLMKEADNQTESLLKALYTEKIGDRKLVLKRI